MSLKAGCSVEWLDEIDSTNSEATRRAAVGHFDDVWIAAKSQTSGRGRLGRHWLSREGNLFATALFHYHRPIREVARIPFAAGLAVHDVFRKFAPDAPVKLKWPNDVRVDEAKLAGILIETGTADDGVWVVAGFGINVMHAPDGVGQDTSSLVILRGDSAVTSKDVLQTLRVAFSDRLKQLETGFAATRKDWLLRADGLGQKVRINLIDASLDGIFEDMAEDGALILRLPDGSRQTISTGDVELIKEVS